MKYSGRRKLFCEFSKLSKLNAFILLGYKTHTDASILVYKFRPEGTGFNKYAEYTRPQLTFFALIPWIKVLKGYKIYFTSNRLGTPHSRPRDIRRSIWFGVISCEGYSPVYRNLKH